MKYSTYIKIKFKSCCPKLQTKHICSGDICWRNVEYAKNITKGQEQSGTVDISSTNCHGYKLCQGKKELSSLGYPFIPNRSSLPFDPSSSTQLPSNHRLTDSHAFEALFFVGKTHIHRHMHTPPQHLIRCRDSPVSALLFCCVLTGRCWAVLACECVQGSEGQSRAAASTPRYGLSLTCLAKRKVLQTPQCTCAVCDNKACMCTDAQFCTMREYVGLA